MAIAAAFSISPIGQANDVELTGRPYIDMNYGPYLSASIEAAPGNIAYKGIAIRLDDGPGGVSKGSEFVVFETDTLRMAAAWNGDEFIDWRSIVYDGSHGTHPKLVGERLFTNPVAPGWARPGTDQFEDPRLRGLDNKPYGPLPRDWGQWRGLFLHNDRVILYYKIGGVRVFESPSLTKLLSGQKVVIRNINIAKRDTDLVLQVAHVAGSEPKLRTVDHQKIAVYENQLTVGVVGGTEETKFEPTAEGHLRLRIPPGEPVTLKLFSSRIKEGVMGMFGAMMIQNSKPENLVALVQSDHERRWPESMKTKPRRMGKPGAFVTEGKISVPCRDQITQLVDTNDDGETDYYRAFNHDAQVTEHFHEFAMGLQTDAHGNFYYTKAARHAKTALVPQHGTLLRVSPDGKTTEIIASGFRAPNGVCVNPDGTFYVSDQEGHWTPKNEINLIEKGKFYGNLMGYHRGLTEADITSPMVWMHNDFDRSPAEQLWVNSDKWGGLGSQLINLSYGTGYVYVVMEEKVNGRVQGGVVRIPDFDFPTGVMRGRFHPGDGQLYACGLFGWAGNKTRPGGFYRLKHTGKPVHLPVAIHATKDGISLTFTNELDAETAADLKSYSVKRWGYRRTRNYGSRDYKADGSQGRDRVEVTGVKLSADKKSVLLQIADMKPTMQMQIEYKIDAADGAYLSHRIQNTIHAIGNNGPFARE